jgi:hypothetical protein
MVTRIYTESKYIRLLAALPLLLIATLLFALMLVTYGDWMDYFRPAASNWLQPYRPSIFNPPWLFLLLHPLALLPARLGVGLLMMASVIIVMAYVKSPAKVIAVICSAPMIALLTLGQIDALPLLGMAIPNGLGLPLILIKPQGTFLAGLRRLNRWSIAVVLLVSAISVLIWGFWWLNMDGTVPLGRSHDVSLFPYTIGVGAVLLYLGIKRGSDALLCWASLCFSPYFMITSALAAVSASVKETEDWKWWAAVVLGSWVYLLVARGSLFAVQ